MFMSSVMTLCNNKMIDGVSPMKVALFGATGFTGQAVLRAALAEGHEVFALVRRPERVEVTHERLHLVQGDALDKAVIKELLSQVEVVLHCLGVGGKGDGKPTTLVSTSVQRVIEVMEELGLRRLICMSNLGAGGSGTWFANKLIIPLFFRWLQPLIEDKNRMEAHLEESTLEWVALRLPNIVEGAAKPVRESEHGRDLSLSITTDSVASYMLTQAAAPSIQYRTPAISN